MTKRACDTAVGSLMLSPTWPACSLSSSSAPSCFRTPPASLSRCRKSASSSLLMDASVAGLQAESKDGVRTNLQMGPSWSVEQRLSAHLSVYTQKEGGHVLGAGASSRQLPLWRAAVEAAGCWLQHREPREHGGRAPSRLLAAG